MSEILKLSHLDDEHRELGGRMGTFEDWELPLSYDSRVEEHRAVRKSCGIFDISHMGQIFVSGEEAGEWLEGLLTNRVAELEVGRSQYTLLLNKQGGVIDDLILCRLNEEGYLLLVNAPFLAKDWAWLEENQKRGIILENASADWAGLAVQGPKAPEIYTAVMEGRTLPSRNEVDDLKHEGERLLVARTGGVGADGFHLFCPSSQVVHWWRAFLEEGVTPCGLEARDSLRLEKCYPLNGADLSSCRSPFEAGLEAFVDLEKGDFVGSEALIRQKEEGVSELLMAIEADENADCLRAGFAVLNEEGNAFSVLTSGGFTPNLGKGMGLAYLPTDQVEIGTLLFLEDGGKRFPAKVVEKPFSRK